jgi:hypothetical protein
MSVGGDELARLADAGEIGCCGTCRHFAGPWHPFGLREASKCATFGVARFGDAIPISRICWEERPLPKAVKLVFY